MKLKGKSDGRSPLTLANMEMLNEQGESLRVGAANGEVVVLTGAPLPGSAQGAAKLPSSGGGAGADGPMPLLVVALGFAALTAGGVLVKRLGRR